MIQKAADWIYQYLLFFLPKGQPHPWDYAAHFIISFALVSIIFIIPKSAGVNFKSSLIAAACATLVIGVIKEFQDWRIGNADMTADMAANLVGIGAAIALILFLTSLMSRST